MFHYLKIEDYDNSQNDNEDNIFFVQFQILISLLQYMSLSINHITFIIRLFHRIKATFMPRVTPKYPFCSHPGPFQGAIFPESVLGIMGAGGIKPATVPENRG
jgi:hypothetical protein